MAERKYLAVNTNPELDPDFGRIPVYEADTYMVTVMPELTSKPQTLEKYYFVLLPISDNQEDSLTLLREILEHFLEENDLFEVRTCQQEDIKKWTKSTPVISFDPAKIDEEKTSLVADVFFWLSPPKSYMN